MGEENAQQMNLAGFNKKIEFKRKNEMREDSDVVCGNFSRNFQMNENTSNIGIKNLTQFLKMYIKHPGSCQFFASAI